MAPSFVESEGKRLTEFGEPPEPRWKYFCVNLTADGTLDLLEFDRRMLEINDQGIYFIPDEREGKCVRKYIILERGGQVLLYVFYPTLGHDGMYRHLGNIGKLLSGGTVTVDYGEQGQQRYFGDFSSTLREELSISDSSEWRRKILPTLFPEWFEVSQ